MKKLKVAIVMPTHFDIHSSLNNFIKTYQYLIEKKNVEVTLFTDRKNDVKIKNFRIEKIKSLDYKTILEKALFVLGIPRYYYRNLNEKLKGFDVINANNPEFYAYSYQAYKAAKKSKTRFILRTSQTVEGFFLFNLTKYLINPFVKKAYDYAKYTVFTNPQAEERCLRLGLIKNSKKSIITGHATDTKCFRPMNINSGKFKKNFRGLLKEQTKRNKKVLLSVGGLYEIKGHHLIIKALKKLIEGGIDAELWIVGEGYYRENLISLARELGVRDKVKFLGKKGHNELAELYNIADVFVLANLQEITPAVNEALSCGTPVVAMECGGYKSVIPNNHYGLISKRLDMADMADKIIRLLKNKKLADSIAANGKKRILDNFSIEQVAEKMYGAFTE